MQPLVKKNDTKYKCVPVITGTIDYRLNHNQGSTDIFAMLQTLNLRLTPFIVAIMMLNHATTPPVSVI